jgi:hypothetical protein
VLEIPAFLDTFHLALTKISTISDRTLKWDSVIEQKTVELGRYLVKDYPEQAAVAIDVLEMALRTLKLRLSPDNRSWYSWAQKDLASLRR